MSEYIKLWFAKAVVETGLSFLVILILLGCFAIWWFLLGGRRGR